MKNIILIGDGGHSKVIQAMIKRSSEFKLIGILDHAIKSPYKKESLFYDNIGNAFNYEKEGYFVLAIGDNKIRNKIIMENDLIDEHFTSIIDPTAIIASNVFLDIGTVVMPGVIINPGTTIGRHSIINTRAVIEHDNTIGDYVHISPSATLTGTVSVHDFAHIGSGATVIPNKTIQENVSIGAGAIVTEDIEKQTVAAGVPAKVIKNKS